MNLRNRWHRWLMVGWGMLLAAAAVAAPPVLKVHTWPGLAPRSYRTFHAVAELTNDDVPFTGWVQAEFDNREGIAWREPVSLGLGTFRYHLYPVAGASPTAATLRVTLWEGEPVRRGEPMRTVEVPLPAGDEADLVVGAVAVGERRLRLDDLAPLTLDALAEARLRNVLLVLQPNDPRSSWQFWFSNEADPRLGTPDDLDAARRLADAGDLQGAMYALRHAVVSHDRSLQEAARRAYAANHQRQVRAWIDAIDRERLPVLGAIYSLRHPQVVNLLDRGRLPDAATGYDAFDLLWWDASRPADLSGIQREALAAWVRQGGRLVLAAASGESGWYPPVNAPPPSADGTIATASLGLGRVIAWRGEPAELASWPRDRLLELVGAADRVVPVGEARQTLATPPPVQPNVRPARGISATRALMQLNLRMEQVLQEAVSRELVGLGDLGARWTGVGDPLRARAMEQLVRAIGSERYPFARLAWLGTAYVLTISLVDYLLVSLIRRRHYTWLTWPLFIAGFSLLFYWTFCRNLFDRPERVEATVLDVDETSGQGRQLRLGCVRLGNRSPLAVPADAGDRWRVNWPNAYGFDLATERAAGPDGHVNLHGLPHGYRDYLRERPAAPTPPLARVSLDAGGQPRLELTRPLPVFHGWLILGGNLYAVGSDLRLAPFVGHATGRGSNRPDLAIVPVVDAIVSWGANADTGAPPLAVPLPGGWQRLAPGQALLVLGLEWETPSFEVESSSVWCYRQLCIVHEEAAP